MHTRFEESVAPEHTRVDSRPLPLILIMAIFLPCNRLGRRRHVKRRWPLSHEHVVRSHFD
ncbi:hypothetical protein KIN20_005783 [Parelaphostrongylus tenuis]|uniref:Uncharacterized protein n=1 Tax=Parelaphostrongylus tenuis TaxID=148309 RepID=A0AAD5M520_PARTN|nr:hypothetical protein KIN20_005783 [Parelaphostrongylus tenuis]